MNMLRSLRLFKFKLLSALRRKLRRCNCYSLIIYVLITITLTMATLTGLYLNLISCSDDDSIVYLEQLCNNYSKGLITGSLCKPLCETKEIEFKKCLGHGIKLHVLRARWKTTTIVLKTSKTLGHRASTWLKRLSSRHNVDHDDFKLTRDEFIDAVNKSIIHDLTGGIHTHHTTRVVNEIFSECDVGNDEVFLVSEVLACLELILTSEYMLYKLLSNSNATPDVYGSCGNMYAVQYVDPEPFMGYKTSFSETRSWKERARLAVAILDLIESIEHTPYGTLYLCDVQEANFGLIKDGNGHYVAKAVDLDISMFKNSLISKLENRIQYSGGGCSKDSDCNFNFRCLGECDMESLKCTTRLKSNNLMIICRYLFKKLYPFHPNLLNNPPTNIADHLSNLLEQCSRAGPSQIERDLFTELKAVLLNSIDVNI